MKELSYRSLYSRAGCNLGILLWPQIVSSALIAFFCSTQEFCKYASTMIRFTSLSVLWDYPFFLKVTSFSFPEQLCGWAVPEVVRRRFSKQSMGRLDPCTWGPELKISSSCFFQQHKSDFYVTATGVRILHRPFSTLHVFWKVASMGRFQLRGRTT